MAVAALLVVTLFFASYGIVCAIQSGASLIYLSPQLAPKVKKYTDMFKPSRELSLGLLIFGLLSFKVLFRNAYSIIYHHFVVLILISLLAILVRAGISFYIYKNKQKARSPYLQLTLILTSYFVPLALSAIGIYMITYREFWGSAVGWTLMFAALFGLTTIGLSMYNRDKSLLRQVKLRQTIEVLFAVWIVLLGFVFPLSLEHYNSSLIGVSLSILEVIITVSVVSYLFLAIKNKKQYEIYQYALLIGFITPILLALNNRPYLISYKILIDSAYSLTHETAVTIIFFYLLLVICMAVALKALNLLSDNIKTLKTKLN